MASIIPKVNKNDQDVTQNKPLKKWLFRVEVPEVKHHETVCVTGNIPELGSWCHEKSVPLQKEVDDIWSGIINIPVCNETKQTAYIEFRYCVCLILESGVIVKSWETFLRPRIIENKEKSPTAREKPHTYATFNDVTAQVSRGWLTQETIVCLKLLNNSINLWSRRYSRKNHLFVKVTAVDLRSRSSSVTSESSEELFSAQSSNKVPLAWIEVASLGSEDSRFSPQEQFGCELKRDDDDGMLVFQNYVLFPQANAFLIDVYSLENSTTDPQHVGFGYLLPNALHSSEGNVVVAVTSKHDHKPLGEIAVNYTVISPLPNINKTCDMSITFARHWKETHLGLDIGHRGSGASFTNKMQNCSEVRENTVASFKNAINYGADFIEFDVQLSKDLVPVVYHDDNVCICTKRKNYVEKSVDVVTLPVKELTWDQLKMLKLFHVSEGKYLNQKFFDEDLEDHQPFPTLKHLLEILDPYVGFNIEIKRPMRKSDGSYTNGTSFNSLTDLNEYLDPILEVVLRYAGSRRIIFSCFNPDICLAVRMKQNKYPVMMLTMGESSILPEKFLADPRTWSLRAAVKCATMFEFLGICPHIDILLKFPLLVRYTINSGLVLFCWGDETADPTVIKQMKGLGVHGLIYDKIQEHSSKSVKESVFLINAKAKHKY